MPSVKIAIDIRRMTEFGVGTYIRNVVRTLGRLDHESKYFLIGPPAKVKEIGSLPPNFHTVPLVAPERSVRGYREFRAALKQLDCDLVHIPNLFSVPRSLPCPYVMTVHDMLEHMSRSRQRSGFWRSLHFQLTKHVLSGAARILAVEHRLYPLAVRLYAEGRLKIDGNRVSITGGQPPEIAALNPAP